MNLTPKERMRRALEREAVDRLPTQINYTRSMGRALAAHLGVSLEELPGRLDNHLLRVDLTYARRLSDDGKVYYDWWGAGWSTEEEGYFLKDAPLSKNPSLDDFEWPDPNDPRLLDGAAQAIAQDHGTHFVAPNFGFSLFERAWSLRGFDTLLMDLLLDPWRRRDDLSPWA
jgi:uroporphyrinogen decarboxylase